MVRNFGANMKIVPNLEANLESAPDPHVLRIEIGSHALASAPTVCDDADSGLGTEKLDIATNEESPEVFETPTAEIGAAAGDVHHRRNAVDVTANLQSYEATEESLNRQQQNHESKFKRKTKFNYRRLVDRGCYFNDGIRRIDYILAYCDNLKRSPYERLCLHGLSISKPENLNESAHPRYRKRFEELLVTCGLELEYEPAENSFDGKTSFVKVHAPWDFLACRAEMLEMKMPIRINDLQLKKEGRSLAKSFFRIISRVNPFALPEEKEAEEPDYFLMNFDRRNMQMFLVSDVTRDTFFTPIQRIRLVDYVLRHVKMEPIHDNKDDERTAQMISTLMTPDRKSTKDLLDTLGSHLIIDLFWLVHHGVYAAAYPLHDCDLIYSPGSDPFAGVNHSYWANFRVIFKYQPLHQIRAYFGEKYALYYAWIGHYNNLLMIPSILSIFCILYGLVTYPDNETVHELCNRNDTICRSCSNVNCPFDELHTYCSYAALSHVFDNDATIAFAFVLSIWCVALRQAWKRKQNELSDIWGTEDEEKLDSAVRSQFMHQAKARRYNPITKREEPYLPAGERIQRKSASVATALFFCALSMGCIASVIIYRATLFSVLSAAGTVDVAIVKRHLPMVVLVITSVINSIIILLLRAFYRKVAWWFTEYECPKTQKQFEISFTYKVVSFQFVNYFGSLFYVAFAKGRFFAPHNQPKHLDFCPPNGCLAEVCIQLVVLMTVLPILQNVWEHWYPAVRTVYSHKQKLEAMYGTAEKGDITVEKSPASWKHSTFLAPVASNLKRWEQDYLLARHTHLDFFDEYLELTIQYGLLTMFASAFPLGVLFALLNNLFELRIDARKYLVHYRRPIPVHDKDLGPWLHIIKVITTIAVVTNGLLLTFTSDIIDRYVYIYLKNNNATTDTYLNYIFTTFKCSDYPKKLGEEMCDRSKGDFDFVIEPNSTNLNNSLKVEECLFRDYRFDYNDPLVGQKGIDAYQLQPNFWQVTTIKLILFILFEHFVFLIQVMMRWAINNTPLHVRQHRQKESRLRQQALLHQQFVTDSESAKQARGNPCNDCANRASRKTDNATQFEALAESGGAAKRQEVKRSRGWELLRKREPGALRQLLEIAEALQPPAIEKPIDEEAKTSTS